MAEPTDAGWLDAAIEAAAEALEKPRGCPVTVWDGPYRMRCSLGGGGWKCSQHGQFRQPGLEERESIARAVISAVAPHIRRAVLLEAAEAVEGGCGCEDDGERMGCGWMGSGQMLRQMAGQVAGNG